MVFTKEQHKVTLTGSRTGALLSLVISLFTITGVIIGVGVWVGKTDSVNNEQTKQIDQLSMDIKGLVTKSDLIVFQETIKSLMNNYVSQVSQITRVNKF